MKYAKHGTNLASETVILLSQQKPDDVIEIDLDIDELDVASAETKPTYEELKRYILEKYNVKVSSLYISQVKKKCGLKIGKNYNMPKGHNTRVPICPIEKEKYIKDTLQHFQVI